MRTTVWILAALVILPTSAFSQPADGAKKKTNVLFIAVDDLRPQLNCYGQSQMKTPNLDALARSGLLFNRAYCQQAVCSPSRTSLLTGRRPDSTKVYDLETHFRDTIPDVVTLPQHFKANGYHTQSFGKIYHGGLDDKVSWSVPHTPAPGAAYADRKILANIQADREKAKAEGLKGRALNRAAKGPPWEAADVTDDGKLPDGGTADNAIAAMRDAKDKPFFLAVGFLKPHLPFVAPKKYFNLYPRESIKLPPNQTPPTDAPKIAFTNFAELRNYMGMPKSDPLSDDQAID